MPSALEVELASSPVQKTGRHVQSVFQVDSICYSIDCYFGNDERVLSLRFGDVHMHVVPDDLFQVNVHWQAERLRLRTVDDRADVDLLHSRRSVRSADLPQQYTAPGAQRHNAGISYFPRRAALVTLLRPPQTARAPQSRRDVGESNAIASLRHRCALRRGSASNGSSHTQRRV